MNAIIYTRVSTADQNYERQIEDLKVHASREKLNVIEVISEKISGNKKNVERAGIKRLMELAGEGAIRKVLVTEVSRLGRNTREVINIVEDLTALGVSIYIQNFNLETLNRNGDRNSIAQMMLTILAEFARMERQSILERSKSGIAKAKREGRHLGRPVGTVKSEHQLLNQYKPVVKLLKSGYSIRKAAKLSDVSINTVQKIKRITLKEAA